MQAIYWRRLKRWFPFFSLSVVENIVGKGENVGYQPFLVLPVVYQNSFFRVSKVGTVWYRVMDDVWMKRRSWRFGANFRSPAITTVEVYRGFSTTKCTYLCGPANPDLSPTIVLTFSPCNNQEKDSLTLLQTTKIYTGLYWEHDIAFNNVRRLKHPDSISTVKTKWERRNCWYLLHVLPILFFKLCYQSIGSKLPDKISLWKERKYCLRKRNTHFLEFLLSHNNFRKLLIMSKLR